MRRTNTFRQKHFLRFHSLYRERARKTDQEHLHYYYYDDDAADDDDDDETFRIQKHSAHSSLLMQKVNYAQLYLGLSLNTHENGAIEPMLTWTS